METIKNYLESMFMSLPNTPEIYKAKDELWQMMEDKYTELKAEGKTENEAVGIVISEFGNLDEIAKDLGIDNVVGKKPDLEKKLFNIDMAKDYISSYSHRACFLSLGVMLCILSICFPIFGEGLCSVSPLYTDALEAVSICLMFVSVAVGVALIIYSNISVSRWNFLKYEPYITDMATTGYINERHTAYKQAYAVSLVIGVALCIISVTPVIIIDALPSTTDSDFADCLSCCLLFIFVAIGVFLIVNSSLNMGIYKRLLSLNDNKTVSGNYVHAQKTAYQYDNKTLNIIMSVYWPTVTCIYLCISFLTFAWNITWIIWPVAAVINALIENIWGHK